MNLLSRKLYHIHLYLFLKATLASIHGLSIRINDNVAKTIENSKPTKNKIHWDEMALLIDLSHQPLGSTVVRAGALI